MRMMLAAVMKILVARCMPCLAAMLFAYRTGQLLIAAAEHSMSNLLLKQAEIRQVKMHARDVSHTAIHDSHLQSQVSLDQCTSTSLGAKQHTQYSHGTRTQSSTPSRNSSPTSLTWLLPHANRVCATLRACAPDEILARLIQTGSESGRAWK